MTDTYTPAPGADPVGRPVRLALTRPVPDSFAKCELTHLARVPIDPAVARAQHAAYERALAALGCEIEQLPAAHDLPDSVFLEDTAVVLDEVAVVTRPGAPSRRSETTAVAFTLAGMRPLHVVSAPATLDGGDVLRVGPTLFVGIGARTNRAGAEQLRSFVEPHGYRVRPVAVRECLHLKSAATEAAPHLVLLNPQWISPSVFTGVATLEVDPEEPFAANVLRVGTAVLCAAAFGRTKARLESAGLQVYEVDVSELAKAEGGLTCCSLIVSR